MRRSGQWRSHDDTEWYIAVCLAQELADGDLRKEVYRDCTVKYKADEWVYVAQAASQVLVAVMTGVVANYLSAVRERQRTVTINDLFTREVREGVAKYERAVDRLRAHRVDTDGSQECVDVLLHDSNKMIRVLKSEDLGGLDIVELLEELRGLSQRQIRERANRLDGQ